MKDSYRIESDTLGDLKVAQDKLWGAQTERSLHNFKIGNQTMPYEIIKALAIAKKAAAFSNCDLGVLSATKRDMIALCCDEILEGTLAVNFPLSVWQTGSGTQTNMNVNEVIANRAELLHHGAINLQKWLSPNDDVNKSQSTNDMFPTAICIATAKLLHDKTIPELEGFILSIKEKEIQFNTIKKIGRTHLMDATPLQLNEEFSAYRSQMEHSIMAIKSTLSHLMELPVGGTAVGNGINTPAGYDKLTVFYINQFTGLNFTPAVNKFEKMADMDSLVAVSGMLKR
ncbi:MAG: class II fumarate hydratase, partial [Bacteroidales bacterium]|nr:class II fumarate hydratase [Bacteroidales bacterium]